MVKRGEDTKAQINYIKANYDKLIIDDFQEQFKCSRSKAYAMLKRNLTPEEYQVFLNHGKKRHTQYARFTSELRQQLVLNFDNIVIKEFIEEHNLSKHAVKRFLRENNLYKIKDAMPHINMTKEQKAELRRQRQASADYYRERCWKLCGMGDVQYDITNARGKLKV